MAGDPDPETSLAILKALPKAGADIFEFGLPFTDPMADGPPIQAAGLRALKAGQTTAKTLALVREFRKDDVDTPVILMGYFNPIYIYGVERFLADAKEAGVDGMIVVDLPPEEDAELCLPALRRSEEHTSELQSRQYLVCRLLIEKKQASPIQSSQRDRTRVVTRQPERPAPAGRVVRVRQMALILPSSLPVQGWDNNGLDAHSVLP